jgi:uncharacterized protein (DUF362 family)
VTHCEFVRAITRILNQKGCTVWIGDSAGGAIAGNSPTSKSLEVSGINKIAAEEKAVTMNFDAWARSTQETTAAYSTGCIWPSPFSTPILSSIFQSSRRTSQVFIPRG